MVASADQIGRSVARTYELVGFLRSRRTDRSLSARLFRRNLPHQLPSFMVGFVKRGPTGMV